MLPISFYPKFYHSLLVLFCILCPLLLPAQDITGLWKGFITTTDKEVPYELAISEVEGKLAGYSYTKFTVNGKEMVAVKSIRIENNNGKVTVSDHDLIYDNFVQSAARQVKQTSNLLLTIDGTLMTMAGDFKTRKTREFRMLSGKIMVQKQDSIKETAIAPMLDSMKLLKDLSFLQPKKPVEIFTAVVPKSADEKLLQQPAFTKTAVAKAPVLQPNAAERKIISEPVMATPPVAVVVAPVKTTPPPPVKATPKPAVVTAKPAAPPPANPTIIASTPPAKPPVPKPTVTGPDFTASLAKRNIETIKTLEFKSDSLMLTLYDNGEVDGDTVSVILNGKMLMSKQGLSTNAINKTIYITPEMGDSLQLVMYAENLGSLPPNSGLLIIRDGTDRYEIRFAGDLSKNAGITLRRKKL